MIKRKQKLGSSSSSICKHKSLNRCGSHIQYRVYYKDAHIRLLGLFSVFFYSLQRKKQKKGGVLVKYLFIPTRRERERDRRLLRKVLFYFRVRQSCVSEGLSPPEAVQLQKRKEKPVAAFLFFLYSFHIFDFISPNSSCVIHFSLHVVHDFLMSYLPLLST